MSGNIIHSSKSRIKPVEREVFRFNQNQQTLAGELASVVVEFALREVCRGKHVEDHPSMVEPDRNKSTGMDPGQDLQTSRGGPSHRALPQSGFPVVGSLDYPDAPPTTPLLPELERSRHSFARKLKGGLAQVYPPSTPPPTPKDIPEGDNNNSEVELMEHLMNSLSTEDSARHSLEVGFCHSAKMEAFADKLSCGIIDWVLIHENRKQLTNGGDLNLLAHKLAETIIASSLDEAGMLV